jgi:lipid II:glycine glycyltransferase (peptidoglycan interpeptide bridge formation enzyme)
MSAAAEQPVVIDATDIEIDEIIAEFGGDYRQAIRALLHDVTQLAIDSEAAVSKGFVRGRLMPFRIGKPS